MTLTWTAVLLVGACGTIEGPEHGDSDSDADTDTDTDTDADADADSDGDTDSVSETETDTDTASDSDTSTGSGTDTDPFWTTCDFDFAAFDCDSAAGVFECHDTALCVWSAGGAEEVVECLTSATPADCADIIRLAVCACDRCATDCRDLGTGDCATCACEACPADFAACVSLCG